MTSEKDQKITVIGMGYVGIPCALSFANSLNIKEVIGIQSSNSEESRRKIKMLNNYQNPLDKDEPYIDEYLFTLKYFHAEFGKPIFTVTDDWKMTEDSDVFIICVQTPVDIYNKFIPDNMISILDNIATYSKCKKPLIVIESTVYPTFTSRFVVNYLKERHFKNLDVDYNLSHAPERVMVGKLIENIKTLPRIIGGVSEDSTGRTLNLYKNLGGDPDRFITMTSTEAELTKTSENAIRDVQIALANELSSVCEMYGADFYKVREGVNSLKGEGVARNLLLPGAGVGGHCLTKDTYLMFNGIDNIPMENSLFLAARDINDNMYRFVIEKLENIVFELYSGEEQHKYKNRGIKIGILGYSFIKNSGDFRETPTQKIIDGILERCCRIKPFGKALDISDLMVHDPYVNFDEATDNGGLQKAIVTTSDLLKVVNFADILIFVVDHDEYKEFKIDELKNKFGISGIVDCKNIFDEEI